MRAIEFKNKFEMLRGQLRHDILSGKNLPGSKLLSEEELAAFHNLNRGTVNKVYSSLETEGLISRKSKVGSVVLGISERKPALRLGGLMMINTGHLYGNLHSLIAKEVQKHRYFPVLLDIEPRMSDIESALGSDMKAFMEASPAFFAVDGFYNYPFEFLKKLSSQIKNLIFFNRCETAIAFSATYVLSDYEKGGYMAIKHLIEGGGRNILIASTIFGPWRVSDLILKGAKKAFAESRIPFAETDIFETDRNGQFEALIERFKGRNKPDAIFCMADNLARKIQTALEKLKLYPGIDYKLIGYFNTPWVYEFEPKLTSVSINETTIAAEFGNLISTPDIAKKEIIVTPKLIIGETA